MRACSPRSILPALAALVLAACSDAETLSPSPHEIGPVGGFSLAIHDQERLVIAAKDGRVLLDGLPPATIADELAPPLAGFAVRDTATTYEMQFGSFRPTNASKGPWRVATRFALGAGAALDLADDAGERLARLTFSAPEEGHLVVDLAPGDGPERRLSWGFACDDGDDFAGFGAQSLDVSHKGFTVPTWVQEQGIGKATDDGYGGVWFLVGTRHASQMPIPQYLSRRGYILTTETNLRSIFALCSEDPAKARIEVEVPSRIHLFDGPSPAESIERATATFGRPRVPPKVAFAPWLDAIQGTESVKELAQKARDLHVPASVIWSEDWRGGSVYPDGSYKLKEEWEVDETLYPDMKGLSNDLHASGFDFHVYFSSFVYKESKAWAEVQANGWLVKHADGSDYVFTGAKLTDTGLLDLDNPQARAWAVKKMRDAMALGADGWMNDFAEWLPTDGLTAAGPSLGRHNLYPVQWQETAREAIDGVNDGQERLFFTRSGWFGTPALADVFWAGDQRTDFETDDGLPTILPIGIGLGLVGISTYGHDIAGYQSATNPPSDRDLYYRWTELGAWSPVMRTHHGTNPTANFVWHHDAESIEHFRRFAALHMALVPYMEGLAKVASSTGLPMWRGLMIPYPDDPKAWTIVDEVMLGDSVLLAPVMTAGAVSRTVYLPEGLWYPWDGGAAVKGGASIEAEAPMTEMPVYVAAGGVIPAYPDGVMTLVHGSPAVPDASFVGDDRVIYAFLGDGGGFAEAGGLSYSLKHVAEAKGDLAISWNGAALVPCEATPVAPCVEPTADGAIARVTGPGKLEVSAGGAKAATLTATGGAAERALTWVVRR